MNELLTFKEVCECITKNIQLQCCLVEAQDDNCWNDFVTNNIAIIDMTTWNYRKKPCLVPWSFDVCPREGWIRDKRNCVVITRIQNIATNYMNNTNWKDLLNKYEYSLNGIDNWIPCGTTQ